MNPSFNGAVAARISLACALSATWGALAGRAQDVASPVELEQVVITATRTPVPASQLGSVVGVLTPEDAARRQLTTLAEALGGVAGTPIQTGAHGGATSLFLRGAGSTQTLLLIDGIRASDSNALYSNLLGGSGVLTTDRIEVVRGPQSTMYGADAIGGAVALTTQRGSGEPSAMVSAEGGSFGTVRGGIAAQGERGATAYNVSVSGLTTQNDRVNNDLESFTGAARIDRQVNASVNVGATVRAYRGEYGSPGAAVGFGANDPDNFERETNVLATVFAEFAGRGDWAGRVTLGGQDRDYKSVDPTPPFGGETNFRTRRGVLDAQASYVGWSAHRLTGGTTIEAQDFESDGYGAPKGSTVDWAVFAQDEWTAADNVFVTVGVRQDQFDSFGGETTGRATIAWQAVPERLKLRASVGTGFRAPSFLELYGLSADGAFGYVGNPDLEPERAVGGDAGFDWTVAGGKGLVSVSYFQNDYDNLINGFAYVPGGEQPYTSVNVGEARSRGAEVGVKLALNEGALLVAGYTYQEADDLSAGTRLLRRPRHAATLDMSQDFGGTFTVGAGATFAADAVDVDALTYANVPAEDYVVARIYGAWRVNDRLTLTARVENLFDEEYAVVNGFPSLGIGGFAGAQWRF